MVGGEVTDPQSPSQCGPWTTSIGVFWGRTENAEFLGSTQKLTNQNLLPILRLRPTALRHYFPGTFRGFWNPDNALLSLTTLRIFRGSEGLESPLNLWLLRNAVAGLWEPPQTQGLWC